MAFGKRYTRQSAGSQYIFKVQFLIEPHVRFAGQPGEQATLFFLDPSGNALEFKAFAELDTQLFAT